MNEHKALYSVIELLLKQKGYKIKSGFEHYDKIEPICIKKQENVYKTMHVEEINLREYLEGGPKKDKCLFLK